MKSIPVFLPAYTVLPDSSPWQNNLPYGILIAHKTQPQLRKGMSVKLLEKTVYRQPLFWLLSILVAVLLAVCLLTGLNRPAEPTAPKDYLGQSGFTGLTENPLAPEDFIYEGDYLTCLSTEAVLGIDVSVWQEQIDWAQVRQSGVEFAVLRLGYRSMHEGALREDSMAKAHYAGAKAAGIAVGAYFFSQAVTPQEAVEEAEFVLELVKDWDLDMPIVFDWEHTGSDTRTAHVNARTLTDCINAFCQTVEAQGYPTMVYFNAFQAENSLYLDELSKYPFWLAQYEQMLDCPYRVNMWQYTNKGRVPGISGDVDLNLYFIYD